MPRLDHNHCPQDFTKPVMHSNKACWAPIMLTLWMCPRTIISIAPCCSTCDQLCWGANEQYWDSLAENWMQQNWRRLDVLRLWTAEMGGNFYGFDTIWSAISIQRHFHPYLECEPRLNSVFGVGWNTQPVKDLLVSVGFISKMVAFGFWWLNCWWCWPEARAVLCHSRRRKITINTSIWNDYCQPRIN